MTSGMPSKLHMTLFQSLVLVFFGPDNINRSAFYEYSVKDFSSLADKDS